MKRLALIVSSVGFLSLTPLFSQLVQAEVYLGGQIGASLPFAFENAQGSGRLGLGRPPTPPASL